MGVGKPRGVRAGRKLKDHRREQRWADKTYNKAMIGSRYRNPFMGASHAKGLVVEKIGVYDNKYFDFLVSPSSQTPPCENA